MPLQKYLELKTYKGFSNSRMRSVDLAIIPYKTVEYAPYIDQLANILILSTFVYDNINFTSYFEFLGDRINIVNGNPAYNEIDGSLGNDYISIGSQLYTILNNSPQYKDYSFQFTTNVNIIEIIIRPKGSGEQYSPDPFGQSPDIIDGFANTFGFTNNTQGQEIDFSAILVVDYQLTAGIKPGAATLSPTLFSKKYSIPYQGYGTIKKVLSQNFQNPYIFDITDFIATNLRVEPTNQFSTDYQAQIKPNFTLFVSYRETEGGQLREYYDLDQEVPTFSLHNSIQIAFLEEYTSDNSILYASPLTGRGLIDNIDEGTDIYRIKVYETSLYNFRQISFINLNQVKIKPRVVIEYNDGSKVQYTLNILDSITMDYHGQISININQIIEFIPNKENIKNILYRIIENDTGTFKTICWQKEIINHEYDNEYDNKYTIMFQNTFGGFDSFMSHQSYDIETTSKKDIFKSNPKYYQNDNVTNVLDIVDKREYGIYNNEVTRKIKVVMDPMTNDELNYFINQITRSKQIYFIRSEGYNRFDTFYLTKTYILDTNSLSYNTTDLGQVISFTLFDTVNQKTINNING